MSTERGREWHMMTRNERLADTVTQGIGWREGAGGVVERGFVDTIS